MTPAGRLALTVYFIRVRYWQSFLPAAHCRAAKSRWEKLATEIFFSHYNTSCGIDPVNIVEGALDELYTFMFPTKLYGQEKPVARQH